MEPKLTAVQMKVLRTLVNLYLSGSNFVSSEDVAKILNKRPGTVRSHMQALRTLGLVEGVPGPRGGYRPTSRAYELLLNHEMSEMAVEIFVNGIQEELDVERIKLTALSNPNTHKAIISLSQEADLNSGDEISIIYAKQLIIQGKVRRVEDNGLIVDVEKIVAIPKKKISQLASQLITVDSEMKVKNAADILSKNGAYCGLVLENGNPVGLLTLDQIVKAVAEKKTESRVKELIKPKIVVGNGEMNISEALKLMRREGVRSLIVLENGKFIGMVSDNQILKYLVNSSRV
jgi:hypothetical protein